MVDVVVVVGVGLVAPLLAVMIDDSWKLTTMTETIITKTVKIDD